MYQDNAELIQLAGASVYHLHQSRDDLLRALSHFLVVIRTIECIEQDSVLCKSGTGSMTWQYIPDFPNKCAHWHMLSRLRETLQHPMALVATNCGRLQMAEHVAISQHSCEHVPSML